MGQLTLAKAKEILPKYTTEDHLFTHAAASVLLWALWLPSTAVTRITGKQSVIFTM